jgi:hypothetical protein
MYNHPAIVRELQQPDFSKENEVAAVLTNVFAVPISTEFLLLEHRAPDPFS